MTFEIKSELPGTFYRSPGPGEAPFLNEGDPVTAETVIGMVELMKQFNEVRAGTVGVLQRFAVADGDAVDTDATLALVTVAP